MCFTPFLLNIQASVPSIPAPLAPFCGDLVRRFWACCNSHMGTIEPHFDGGTPHGFSGDRWTGSVMYRKLSLRHDPIGSPSSRIDESTTRTHIPTIHEKGLRTSLLSLQPRHVLPLFFPATCGPQGHGNIIAQLVPKGPRYCF